MPRLYHLPTRFLLAGRVLSAAPAGAESRKDAFVATLMDEGVEFTAVDNPHANKLTVHILAAVAQHEREMISERTTAALQAAKARGVRLGNSNLSEAAAIGRARAQVAAQQRADNVLPVIRELQAAGATSHNAIAKKLNARNVPTARGRKWSHVQVAAVLARAKLYSGGGTIRAAIAPGGLGTK